MADGPMVEELQAEVTRLQGELNATTELRGAAEARAQAAEAGADEHVARAAVAAGELATAKAEAEELRKQLVRVPAGAGERQGPDLSALSAGEKIRLGLEQRAGR